MVVVAQLVRAPVCGSGGRGFKSHLPPFFEKGEYLLVFFSFYQSGIKMEVWDQDEN